MTTTTTTAKPTYIAQIPPVVLNSHNVELSGKRFYDAYMLATSVFNGFYGCIAMIASDALNDAQDVYECDRRTYRMNVKRTFKQTQASWARFWDTVKLLFGDKYGVYIDFINQSVADMQDDIRKLYLSVHASLLAQRIDDADRRAYLYMADIITHEMRSVYVKYIDGLIEETHLPRLADTFTWADPTHIARLTHEIVKAACPVDITMNDDVLLSVQIIAQKAFSDERQDAAAMRALEYDSNARHREAMADDIALYKRKLAEKRDAEQRQRDAYQRERDEQRRRRRHNKSETLTADAIAERLSAKFNVKR